MTATKPAEMIVEGSIVQEHQPPVVVEQRDGLLSVIERFLLRDDTPVDKLMAMIDVKERLDATQARKAFDLAISLAKAEIPPIVKNRHVKFESKTGGARTDYKHEDLAGIAAIVDPILGKYGLSYRYRTKQPTADRVSVTCVLSHRDGHSEETELSSGVDASGNKNAIQAIGSAITFLERYTLKAALGLASAHDDDGAASGSAPKWITEEQYRELSELIARSGANVNGFLAVYGVDDLHDLPANMVEAARTLLQQKIAAAVAKAKEAKA